MRRGVTLLELLTVLVIAVLLAAGLAESFSAAVHYQLNARAPRQTFRAQADFEDRLRNAIARAFVDSDLANDHTYFIGRVDATGNNANDSGTGSTELIFTTEGASLPGLAAESPDTDFQVRNETLGPIGGVTENRMALTPIGEAGNTQGLFLRKQTPADEDPDQGGFESVLSDQVTSISFEFYDGTDWVAEWDTQTADRRLPAAVRITYTLLDDETSHVLIVKLRNSDVTPNNPANGTATGGTA